MEQDFTLPSECIGRFAIVKLWPELKTAEDECIARLKIAAKNLGLECIEIHADGRFLESKDKFINKKDVDFVIHLHYDTPKCYDAFSFVALWNPIQFYHEWGYSRTSRNLLSHDDFISCSAQPADDHVGRLIRNSTTHLPPFFKLYHSVSDTIHPPSLGDRKLFYAGINWDALRGGVSRHQELLKRLDTTEHLRIYGPSIFQGVRVWKGYRSYVRELPFDGVSMIDEIAKAGIALVLSSHAHKESELMSNRLFESIAAGAMVICDENKFAKKFFDDSLLYIDTRCDIDDIYNTIENHLDWINKNPVQAIEMIKKAQSIFKNKFALTINLRELYNGFRNRKYELVKKSEPQFRNFLKIGLCFLFPEYSEEILNNHINSIKVQEYEDFLATIVIDKMAYTKNRFSIETALSTMPKKPDILEVDFCEYDEQQNKIRNYNTGRVIATVLTTIKNIDAIIFIAPSERIFSNHLQVLSASLARNPSTNCAATAVILKQKDQTIHSVYEKIDFRQFDPASPIGYARFIFRISGLPKDLNLALPYLDRKTMAVLIGDNAVNQEVPSTVMIDMTNEFPIGPWDEGKENNLIASYSPKAFHVLSGYEIILPNLNYSSISTALASSMIKRLSWNWVVYQMSAVRKYGLFQRLRLLKRKINSRLA